MHKPMRKLIIIILNLTCLISCGDCDVKKFVKKTQLNKGAVEPLPQLMMFKPYRYTAGNIRSPFDENPFNEKTINIETNNDNTQNEMLKLQASAESQRPKYYLEQFPLDRLKYVGSMTIKDYSWALIIDPNGELHHVQVGDYLGQRNGKIKQILEQKIIIRELSPNNDGDWEKNDVDLQLTVKTKKDDVKSNDIDRETSA
jgi:type IV pilus assembly protein PilP